jgi:hypothetical protein
MMPWSCRIIMSLILLMSPFSLTAIAYGQGQGQGQGQGSGLGSSQAPLGTISNPIPDRFIPINLVGNWTLYNETSGSQSSITFNSDGSYTRNLHGNNLTGNWQSNIVVEQRVGLCPTEPKFTERCIQVGLLVENPHRIIFTDGHGNRIFLMR